MRQSLCKPARHRLGAPDSAEVTAAFAAVYELNRVHLISTTRQRVKREAADEALTEALRKRGHYRDWKAAHQPRRLDARRVTIALQNRLAIAAAKKAARQAEVFHNREERQRRHAARDAAAYERQAADQRAAAAAIASAPDA